MAIYPTSSNSFRKTDYPRPVVENYAPDTVLRPGDFAIPAGAPRPSWMPDSSNQISGNLAGVLNEYGNPAPRQPEQMPVIPMQDAVIPANPNIPTARQMLEDNMLRNPNQYSSAAVGAVRQRKWDEQAPQRAAAEAEQKRRELADAIALRRSGFEAAGEAALKVARERGGVAKELKGMDIASREKISGNSIGSKERMQANSIYAQEMKQASEQAFKSGENDKGRELKKNQYEAEIAAKRDQSVAEGKSILNADGSVNPAWARDQQQELQSKIAVLNAEGTIDSQKMARELEVKAVMSMAQFLISQDPKAKLADVFAKASEAYGMVEQGLPKATPVTAPDPAATQGAATGSVALDTDGNPNTPSESIPSAVVAESRKTVLNFPPDVAEKKWTSGAWTDEKYARYKKALAYAKAADAKDMADAKNSLNPKQ